ncbi:efflux RND transporter permease subunit [Sulfurovum sp. NBC37-1]|uniref:efflux RND transporter permease subunit n=1 Tax=Sulfurovum sp. (strain NBC37-1) TaxID=387093 RepID=UPI00015876DD|nr:MMPL family transporter [Sulfurovum sp. NBC37-1]BAF71901.1 efflux transporter, RND superfamily [Sulfurovum sp. NBC37-1]
MQKYIDFLDTYKYRLILFITLITLLLSFSLRHIAYEGNYRIWFDADSRIVTSYDAFRNTFGGDDTFVVAFEDRHGIFRAKAIETVLELTRQFQKIKGVQKVDSLTNYQNIRSEDDDIIVEDFIDERTDDLKAKRVLALHDPLIVNHLISKDGETTLIAVKLASLQGSDEAVNIEVMQKLQSILKKTEKETGYRFYLSGVPAITASLVTVSQHDALLLMPLAVVIVVMILWLLFRDVMGVLVPSVVIVFTFLIVLSMQILSGYKLNNFTVNIPSFISAIAIADAMHLFLAWGYYRQKGLMNKEAVTVALQKNFLPIAMTSFTTATGFATLGLSAIEPIATLGIAITSGAFIAFVLSVTLAPAILLTRKENHTAKPVHFLDISNITGYGAFIARHDRKIIVIFVLLFLLAGYGLRYVKVDSNSIKYFSPDTVVRSGSDFIEKHITGPMVYEVVLDSGRKEGIKDPKFLEKIIDFEKALKQQFPVVRFSISLKDIIVRMQKTLNPNTGMTVPDDKNLVAQYLLLYSMSLPQGMEINDQVDTNERYLRLTLNLNVQDTSKDLEMIAWIKKWWRTHTSYSADVQGQAAIFAYMQNSVTDTLVISIVSTLLVVMVAMFLIFRNLKMLLLFILPNVAPLILVAGVMGYLGIHIDIGVAISAAVILGIAVDDTIHFFSKFFDAIKEKSFEESIDYVMSHSGNAMILTTLILSLTFAVFGVSRFIPNVNFAIVTVIALNIALVLDLLLLPALLNLVYKSRF